MLASRSPGQRGAHPTRRAERDLDAGSRVADQLDRGALQSRHDGGRDRGAVVDDEPDDGVFGIDGGDRVDRRAVDVDARRGDRFGREPHGGDDVDGDLGSADASTATTSSGSAAGGASRATSSIETAAAKGCPPTAPLSTPCARRLSMSMVKRPADQEGGAMNITAEQARVGGNGRGGGSGLRGRCLCIDRPRPTDGDGGSRARGARAAGPRRRRVPRRNVGAADVPAGAGDGPAPDPGRRPPGRDPAGRGRGHRRATAGAERDGAGRVHRLARRPPRRRRQPQAHGVTPTT